MFGACDFLVCALGMKCGGFEMMTCGGFEMMTFANGRIE